MTLNGWKNNMRMCFRVIRDNKLWINKQEDQKTFYQYIYQTLRSEHLKILERNTFKTKEGLLEVLQVVKK